MATILCIEPDDRLAHAYKTILMHQGHVVVRVPGAQAAIHAAEKQPLDLVMLELDLPGHNGIAFLHEFRSYAEWADIPVMIHSSARGVLQKAIDVHGRELGVAAVCYKPETSLRDLCDTVQNIVS